MLTFWHVTLDIQCELLEAKTQKYQMLELIRDLRKSEVGCLPRPRPQGDGTSGFFTQVSESGTREGKATMLPVYDLGTSLSSVRGS